MPPPAARSSSGSPAQPSGRSAGSCARLRRRRVRHPPRCSPRTSDGRRSVTLSSEVAGGGRLPSLPDPRRAARPRCIAGCSHVRIPSAHDRRTHISRVAHPPPLGLRYGGAAPTSTHPPGALHGIGPEGPRSNPGPSHGPAPRVRHSSTCESSRAPLAPASLRTLQPRSQLAPMASAHWWQRRHTSSAIGTRGGCRCRAHVLV